MHLLVLLVLDPDTAPSAATRSTTGTAIRTATSTKYLSTATSASTARPTTTSAATTSASTAGPTTSTATISSSTYY